VLSREKTSPSYFGMDHHLLASKGIFLSLLEQLMQQARKFTSKLMTFTCCIGQHQHVQPYGGLQKHLWLPSNEMTFLQAWVRRENCSRRVEGL
jgi:hypothetical protein